MSTNHQELPVIARTNDSIPAPALPRFLFESSIFLNQFGRSATIHHMPPELLTETFRFLTASEDILHCTKVSRKWCNCAMELLWREPDLDSYSSCVEMSHVLCSSLQTFPYARFIRNLDFKECGSDLEDDVLLRFIRCNRLEQLGLNNCDTISNQTLTHFFTHFPNLVRVKFFSCSQITDDVLAILARTAKRLERIKLVECSNVGESGILALAKGCPLLRRVELRDAPHITDTAVATLVKLCPLLERIIATECVQVSDLSVQSLWQHSTRLRDMCICGCPELTDLAFPAPPRINQAAGHSVDVFAPSSVANDTQKILSSPLVQAYALGRLQGLDLSWCPLITDKAIEGIVAHIPQLRELYLHGCVQLTDRAVEVISRLGRSLETLNLGRLDKITDTSICLLTRSCTELEDLSIPQCPRLTDASVLGFSTLHKLRNVDLGWLGNLTDVAVQALTENNTRLKYIDLSICMKITARSIYPMLLQLQDLEYLNLAGAWVFQTRKFARRCSLIVPEGSILEQEMESHVFSYQGLQELEDFLELVEEEDYETDSDSGSIVELEE